jgi:hypothetical protein
MSEPTIACSLNAGDREKRLEATTDLRARAILETQPTATGVRLRFAARPGIREELQWLITSESKCCPFLRFELQQADGELILAVSGPDEARPVIEDLFGLEVPSADE